jgi:hypothetical protein
MPWVNAIISIKKNQFFEFQRVSKKGQSKINHIVYRSKYGIPRFKKINRFKFYISFLLVATKCTIMDYWFYKPKMKGPKFSFNYKCNYPNYTQGTQVPTMNRNQSIIDYEHSNKNHK